MNTLIIYDATGYVLFYGSGSVREPIGMLFLWVEIPTGKQIKITDGIGVDVTVIPNIAILEDIPKTEVEILQTQLKNSQQNSSLLNDTIVSFIEYMQESIPDLPQ